MKLSQKAMLALEDGAVFEGSSFRCPCITNLSVAEAVVNAIESLRRGMSVKSVQEYHRGIPSPSPTLQKTVTVYPTVV